MSDDTRKWSWQELSLAQGEHGVDLSKLRWEHKEAALLLAERGCALVFASDDGEDAELHDRGVELCAAATELLAPWKAEPDEELWVHTESVLLELLEGSEAADTWVSLWW